MPISEDLLKNNINYFFIETGSANGATIFKALSVGFKEIFSVEVSKRRYKRCKKKFRENSNVNLFVGDSPQFIRKVMKNMDGQITFWLDAHPNKMEDPNPLLDELSAILKHHIKTHTILIDDMRLMGQGVWPSKEKIIEFIRNINSDYVISYEDNYDAKHDIHRQNEIMVCKI